MDQFTYANLLQQMKTLANEYSGLPTSAILGAYSRAKANNPWIQNKRVRQINSLPADYSKDVIGDAIKDPGANGFTLRGVHRALEATAYPMLKIRKVYTDLITYRNYNAPAYLVNEADAKKPEFIREMALLDKFREQLQPAAEAHKITGQAIQNGKVFYTIRYDVDKPHNSVRYAFLQQLPQDWVKIIGFNSISGYTVSFDLFYFLQPGTDWRQFGDLLVPYLDDFNTVIRQPSKAVYASKKRCLDTQSLNDMSQAGPIAVEPEVYGQNGRWAYWVTLPVDKLWTCEVEATTANAASTLTGLYRPMAALGTS